MKRARGVALVIVLVLTMILGLLIAQLSLTTQAQTDRAQALTDLAEQRLALHSAEAEILFALLTRPWESGGALLQETDASARQLPIESVWHFDSMPFKHSGAEYVVQDLSGRLPLPQIGDSMQVLEAALIRLGYPRVAAEAKSRKLLEFYSEIRASGKVQGSPIQSMSDLGGLLEIPTRDLEQLRQTFTLYPVTQFNINSASPMTLGLRYPGFLADSALMLRSRSPLDAAAFFRLTGTSTDDFTVFFPGPAFEIRTRASRGSVTSEDLAVWVVQPYELDPLRLWERRRPQAVERFQ